MTITFAPARTAALSPVVRALCASVPLHAANDNHGAENPAGDALFHAALRHFARHGLSAARHAADFADEAAAAGEAAEARYWLAICRTLDKRLAATTARRLDLDAAP